ncbi:DUF6055 domain-containing protein [Paraflavitalea speifideaquila]|uniref:DUF6055 domain-containing protein n=1 Tax=Paraflavitalea speifideaquila TaxID=3076558 RepID=UPI0028F162EE|nr:DUF6055 domain-containing protein [Paraflavitalea speifideiaquila]
MTPNSTRNLLPYLVPFFLLIVTGTLQATAQASTTPDTIGKQLFIPAKIYRIPDSNDYNNNESDYSYQRMVQSANIAVFWHKEFGNDPTANPDERSASTHPKH